MRWTAGPRLNLDDRRARSGMSRGTVGGVGGLLVAVVLSLLFGKDFITGGGLGSPSSSPAHQAEGPLQTTPEEEKLVDFIVFVFNDQMKIWREILGDRFQDSTLVIYRGGTETGCGFGQAAVGPFYCPADGKVYLDLSFFADLDRSLGAPGDFAQAYVIGHELGHHVQNLLGTDEKVARAGRTNAQQVMMELQADCFAGLWAYHAARRDASQAGSLERGDVEEALGAAMSIGDDTLSRKAGRAIRPESFTHGSSAQRKAWFERGFERGKFEDCDTFTN